jgi:hypothetical protein
VPAPVAEGAMTCATTSSLAAVTGAPYRMTAGSSSASTSPFDAVERGPAAWDTALSVEKATSRRPRGPDDLSRQRLLCHLSAAWGRLCRLQPTL